MKPKHNTEPEADLQEVLPATKYRLLLARVADAKARGERFILRGAKEIALYVKQSEAFARWVYRQTWLPLHREGNGLCLDVEVFETYLEVQRYCAIHSLDVDAELKRRGVYEPRATKR